MTQNYQKIGDYISLLDKRNSDGSITNLMGISIDKCYIPSVANVIGTDLHNYKVIKKGQFACSLMQVSRDQRIPLAMYTSDEPAIMSPAYMMFEVNRPDEILPEYMELWFKRAEFDREASFYAVGGVRGSLDWEDFCKMKLPVPPISEQRKIVHDYQVITNRIEILKRINENLEQQAMAMFKAWFVDHSPFGGKLPLDWKEYKLGEFLPVITGKKNANVSSDHGEYPFFSCSQDIAWTNDYSFEGDAILVAGNGDFNVKFYSGKFEAYQRTYVLIPRNPRFTAWLFYAVKHNLNIITLAARGSVIKFITKGNLEDFTFHAPIDLDNCPIIDHFTSINNQIALNREENSKLSETRDALLPRLMSGELDVSELDL